MDWLNLAYILGLGHDDTFVCLLVHLNTSERELTYILSLIQMGIWLLALRFVLQSIDPLHRFHRQHELLGPPKFCFVLVCIVRMRMGRRVLE